jgi:hypothetical protein
MGHPLHRISAVALAAGLALGLSACGGSPAEPGASGSASTSPSVSPYATPVPAGVTLTTPGTALKVGQHAVIAWHPKQNEVATLDVRVRRLERTTFDKSFQGWAVGPTQAAMTPYFVRATVKNVSTDDLGGLPVPIYGQDDAARLVASQPFSQRVFEPCNPAVLPKKFAPGATTELCFVFLMAPGHDLASIAFPPQDASGSLAPITWKGKPTTKVLPPKPSKAPKKAGKTKKTGQ